MRLGRSGKILVVFAPLAVTALLWARSYWVCDSLDWGTSTGRAGLFSFQGRLGIGRVMVPPSAMARIPHGASYRAEPAGAASATFLRPGWWSWTGIQVAHVRHSGFVASDVRIPYWPLLVLACIPPFLWWLLHRARPVGVCKRCGYDLRATPQRCPECGTVAA